MSALDLGDLVLIASRVLGVDAAVALDLVDLDAAEAALAEAAEEDPAAPPEERAAALLCGLLDRQPLGRGNRRVAVVATLQLLATDGLEVEPEPPEALPALVARITAGTAGRAEAAAWLAGRLRPLDKENGMLRRFGGRGQRRPLFQRFSERARRAVTLAQEEARELHHNYVGTEHLLLGLLRVPEGVAARALASFGVSHEAVLAQVERIIGRGTAAPRGHIPFTPRSKKVLELALREALQLGHNYIGTEHVLLGLVREGEGVAAQVMVGLGADLPRVRQQVTDLLEDAPRRTADHKQLVLEELGAVFDENERLAAEVQRLRDLLREHGIDPDNGASRSA